MESLNALKPLAQLKHLDIGNNPTITDYTILQQLKSLSSLSVRSNKLTDLEWATPLSYLDNLDVRWNKIAVIPDALNHWKIPIVNTLEKGINVYGNLINA